MAGDKFKGLFDFINNFGDATVNVSVHEPASGKTEWVFGRRLRRPPAVTL